MSLVSTPCLRLCALDGSRAFCVGCGRTRAEITAWGRMSEAQRLAVMAVLSARLEAAAAPGPSVPAAREPMPGGCRS